MISHLILSWQVWNWSFEQATYNLHQANISVLQQGDPWRLNYDNVSNVGYWAVRRVPAMLKHISDIFKTVFGAAAVGRNARVRPVYAGQVVNAYFLENGLQYMEAVWGHPSLFFHSVAGAPYFDPGPVDESPALTADQVLQGWQDSVANLSIARGLGGPNYLAKYSALAAYYGLSFQAYEGGPDTVEGIDQGGPLYAKANASVDPRITPICVEYLKVWSEYGQMMGPLNWFAIGAADTLDQYGIYAVLWSMAVPHTPKVAAIDATRVQALPPPSPSLPRLPVAQYNASLYAGHPVPARPIWFPGENATFFYFFVNEHPPSTTPVTITIYAALESTTPAPVEVSLAAKEGPAVATLTTTCSPTKDWTTAGPCTPLQLPGPALWQGVVVLRLRELKQFVAVAAIDVAL